MMRNSNLNSVSTENQHEILMKFGKCLLKEYTDSKRNSQSRIFKILQYVVVKRLQKGNKFDSKFF